MRKYDYKMVKLTANVFSDKINELASKGYRISHVIKGDIVGNIIVFMEKELSDEPEMICENKNTI